MRGGDEKLRIKNPTTSILNILYGHRVHVVNHELGTNVVPRDTQITGGIPEYDLLSNVSPFRRPVESLVDPAIEAERGLSDFAAEC